MATIRKITPLIVNKNPEDPNVRDSEHAHELGGTLGMAIGGIAGGIAAGVAAGATIGGASAGPIGAVAGAAIGGAVAGVAGERIAREINPTAEEQYWENEYSNRPYATKQRTYEAYRPAYRYGVDSYSKHAGREFNEIEPSLRQDWEKARGTSSLEWADASSAARDAYDRLKDRQ